jgi:hypothetical protein
VIFLLVRSAFVPSQVNSWKKGRPEQSAPFAPKQCPMAVSSPNAPQSAGRISLTVRPVSSHWIVRTPCKAMTEKRRLKMSSEAVKNRSSMPGIGNSGAGAGVSVEAPPSSLQSVLKKCFGLDSTDHNMDHRHVDHRLTARREILVVFAQPAVFSKPAESPFDHPSFG